MAAHHQTERATSLPVVPTTAFSYTSTFRTDIVKEGITKQGLEEEVDVPFAELECLDSKVPAACDAIEL